MNIHIKTQHSENVEQFLCLACDRTFSVKSNLKAHMKRCKRLLMEEETESIPADMEEDVPVVCVNVDNAGEEMKVGDNTDNHNFAEEEENCEIVE